MKLHYRTMGEGEPLIILHGVFGSSDNWQTLGRRFSEWRKVFAVDLRDHGKSPHSNSFDLESMAGDIEELVKDEGLDQAALIGHSLGGKVAMRFTQRNPKSVSHLIVADMAPKEYEMRHGPILDALKALDLKSIEGRKDADEQMAERIPQFGIRQFLLKNLQRKGQDEWEWKLNLPVIERDFPRINDPLPEEAVSVPTLFLRGEKSDYILDEDEPLIKRYFPYSEIHTIEGAGHWVHAEAPEAFFEEVEAFLRG